MLELSTRVHSLAKKWLKRSASSSKWVIWRGGVHGIFLLFSNVLMLFSNVLNNYRNVFELSYLLISAFRNCWFELIYLGSINFAETHVLCCCLDASIVLINRFWKYWSTWNNWIPFYSLIIFIRSILFLDQIFQFSGDIRGTIIIANFHDSRLLLSFMVPVQKVVLPCKLSVSVIVNSI